MVALDFLIEDDPDSTLLIRSLGVGLVTSLIVIFQYGYIFLNIIY